MKWLFSTFMVLVVICGGAFYYLTSSNGYYSTKEYYVKMIADPIVERDRLSSGEMSTNKVYNVTGYDKEGKESFELHQMMFLRKINIILYIGKIEEALFLRKKKSIKPRLTKQS
ncbi:YxeA family protein [Bacillus wiedmannii]|uniref:YxeA family protein n=1 Tax=Bacillus wiedmannii TaxID=1890302 RepID=UPI001F4F7C0D|nr:YxeA family protein [Bacillus wiedmannii]